MTDTPVKTPCSKVCIVDHISGLCIGCGRSLQEIGSWLAFSAEHRATIMSALPGRLKALRARGIDNFPD